MQYAEDKRTSNGWYVTHNDEGCYETGYIAGARTRKNRVQYENAIDACAVFIKHEIEIFGPVNDYKAKWGSPH